MNIKYAVPLLFAALIAFPVIAGTLSVVLPALGYFPALGEYAVSLEHITKASEERSFVKMALLSLASGIGSTLLAVMMSAAILALAFTSRNIGRINALFRPLLVVPHAAAAVALAFVLTPGGLIMRLISPELSGLSLPPNWAFPNDQYGMAMTLVLALKETPFIVLLASALLTQAQRKQKLHSHVQVARTLGYSSLSSFVFVVWPQIYPLVRLPILAVLVYTGTSIEIPLVLGPGSPPTLAVHVLAEIQHVELGNRMYASALAVWLFALSILSIGVWLGIEKAAAALVQLFRSRWLNAASTSILQVGSFTGIVLVVLAIVLGGLSILLSAFAGHWAFGDAFPESFTTLHWASVMPSLLQPLGNSLIIGFVTAFASVSSCVLVLELLAGKTGKLRMITVLQYLPLLVPMILFMYGAQSFITGIAGNEAVWLTVILLHYGMVVPYIWFSLSRQYQSFDPQLVNLARTLGARPWAVFLRLKLPLLGPSFLVALALGIAMSFSQYLPTLLGSSGLIETVTTEAVALASGGSRRITAVYVLVQVLMPLAVFVGIGLLLSCIRSLRWAKLRFLDSY